MTAKELKEHAEYDTIVWDLKPAKKGKVRVAAGRGGPFEIAYEIHGNGALKLVVGHRKEHSLQISYSPSIFKQ